ncbi:MAG: alpha/beta hydrolase family protein [Planctomycetaceae bacterium]
MRTLLFTAVFVISAACGLADDQKPAKDPSRVLPAGKLPKDARLGTPRTLNDKYHPWTPPKTKAEWLKERRRIRERVLVSQGLWPMPPKTPLKPVVHGKIDRGDYTIEKVYFQSHPGHYVTGNLYRPKPKRLAATRRGARSPGILCPHGHWRNGRFYDAGEKKAKQQIAKGAETHLAGARFPVQARMVQLARMGCVVFHYDMVGYADSQQFGHRQGFTDVKAGLRLQNFMGLQTWNSIRALDFLISLKDVDPKRIGVTGSSGGGTQTFMLCAVDDRPAVAFPAVMVSTGMQGGCVCENAEYLRIGINNIALAALFAPKPLAMSGAHDWTIAIETKGYPELRQVYGFYGKKDNVYAKAFPQFQHNYNQVAREMMYEWFNRHLQLGHKSPIHERDFKPVPPKELSVYDDDHPRPKTDTGELRAYLTKVSQQQYRALLPKTKADVKRYREVVGTAARVMFGDVPDWKQTAMQPTKPMPVLFETSFLFNGLIYRKGIRELVPILLVGPKNPKDTSKMDGVFWFDTAGKKHLLSKQGKPKKAVAKITDEGAAVVSADVFGTGEFLSDGKPFKHSVNSGYAGYTHGYNRPLLANRVRDMLTLHGRSVGGTKRYVLVGSGDAGPWAVLAAARMTRKPDKIIIDLNGFSFSKIKKTSDPNFLPGALKYGGIGGLAALAAPTELVIYGTKGVPEKELAPLKAVYKAAGGKLTLHAGRLTDELVVKEVLKKK